LPVYLLAELLAGAAAAALYTVIARTPADTADTTDTTDAVAADPAHV